MFKDTRKKDALTYHAEPRPGKIEVVPTKETKTQRDLSLAYSPGVAEPCIEIAAHPSDIYRYTAKGNLVAVISNGTAVLGLGNIGPAAAKPVMEGKGLLFKIFADIDVFDLELNTENVDEFVQVVKALEPTFGGINLEDIRAPQSFEIEERLKAELDIPVMHDDQHGTAIICGAALLNTLELVNKKIEDANIVVSGAGAAAISSAKLALELGASRSNIVMVDSHGVINQERKDIDKYKSFFATERKVSSLKEAMINADVFIGLSIANVLTSEMLLSMSENPIVFAMANPDPEIDYELAKRTRNDVVLATGRSDYPNQVNNVLGFPYIFRGALDVQATTINEEMKLAAVYALAQLAKEPVPEIVNTAYREKNLVFGRDYFIPKPVDPRLLTTVAPAVAKAAIKSNVARKIITDWEKYKEDLTTRLGIENQIVRVEVNKAKKNPKKVIFSEADDYRILKAAQILLDEKIAYPVLLGDEKKIKAILKENTLMLPNVPIINPRSESMAEKRELFANILYEKRKRKGLNKHEAEKLMRDSNYFGIMMVENEEADAFISGLSREYPETIRPALQITGTMDGVKKVAGMYILLTKKGPLFFADTTVNVNPSVEDLVDITLLTAKAVRQFNITPRIALLSYSNFGSSKGEEPARVRRAYEIIREREPDLIVDGEMQANLAFNQEILMANYPFSNLAGGSANTLIFPNLAAGNIAYKLLREIVASETIGPILIGLKKPVHVLQIGSTVNEIVNMATIAVVDAQNRSR